MKEKLIKELYQPYIENLNNQLYIIDAKQFVPGKGNCNSKIVFVGEAPGAEEENFGIPFCGRSGKLLRFYLNKYHFIDDEIFITNVVKYRPPQNRKPTTEEINSHGQILREEISIINPQIIVTIGSIATHFLLNTVTSISQVRGKIFNKKTASGASIYPIFHPAYILRNQSLLPIFEKDIAELEKIIKNA